MNIMLVSRMTVNSPTGVTTYYLTLKDEYLKQGYNVSIVTPENTPRVVSFLLKIYNRIHSLLIRSGYYKILFTEYGHFVSIYFAAKKEGKNIRWDIVHGQDPCSTCATIMAFKGKFLTLMTCHFNDNPVVENHLRYNLSEKQQQQTSSLFKYFFSKVKNYIFVSKHIYEKSKYLLGESPNYVIIGNGVTFPKITPRKDNKIFTITNVGTLETRKNQILLIDAALHLVKAGFSFRIFFLGNGPKMVEWQQKVKDYGLTDNISFLGYRIDRFETVAHSDIYIHVSLNESWGLVITEAIALRIPVLALNTGGISEQFPLSGIGLLPQDINPEEMANAIIHYSSPGLLQQTQKEQHNYASSRFTMDLMIDKTLNFYKSINA